MIMAPKVRTKKQASYKRQYRGKRYPFDMSKDNWPIKSMYRVWNRCIKGWESIYVLDWEG